MKNRKRMLSLLIAISLLASGMVSCADNSDGKETDGTTDTKAPDTTTVEEVTTVDPLADNLPDDITFDGYKFRIGSSPAVDVGNVSSWYH